MKRYITLLSLGLCLALPMLSQASDINLLCMLRMYIMVNIMRH